MIYVCDVVRVRRERSMMEYNPMRTASGGQGIRRIASGEPSLVSPRDDSSSAWR